MSESRSVEVIFEKEVDSPEEPPMEEWSSVILQVPEENLKRINYGKGLYDPGSGEICAKYLPMSASSVLRLPYFTYPAVIDPGIHEALLNPEPANIYPNDGQELYLTLCKEAGLCPIASFYRQLLQNKINLRYYGVHPMAFKVISMALKLNKFVTILDLTDNWINEDGCFYLGEMLAKNNTLKVLVLHGCRIRSEGARRLFVNLPQNSVLRELNLCKNQLNDKGVEYLANAIGLSANISNLDLSYNSLTEDSVNFLVDAFEKNNKLTHLNLSWNMIRSPNTIFSLCSKLAENKSFLDLNLSWNSLSDFRVGKSINLLLRNKNFSYLNLSNNRLYGQAISSIAAGLGKGGNLVLLDLSSNPLSPQDAYKLLLPMTISSVKLQKLLLDNVYVTSDFIKLPNEILSMKFRENVQIIYGGVYAEAVHKSVHLKDLVLNKIDYLSKKSKKQSADIALIVMELYKADKEPMDSKSFIRALKDRGLPLEEELADQLTCLFAGPAKPKSATVNLATMVEYFKRKWPERQLPPTPPPEPMPAPVIIKK
ncbi:unnamed protein product [Parnassius apollo]|uniref:(apollo) hypothetical protein n=1 Tax=Parnassius apollo TaxID=110799 RepID=A0A8S3Y694_PARAO|nr:unnamed protein product [Parnassius apollo]